jgi:tetratricopeptide (TPR) repeat protein
MNNMRYTEWIDKYVDGELDEEGIRQFEAELASNRSLAMEFQLDKDIEKALMEADMLDLRAKCFVAQEELKLSERKLAQVVQFTRKYWYAVASVFLVALITGGLLLFNPGAYSTEKLFKMYYKSGETVGISRSGNANMVEALRCFSKNEYKAADGLFDKILASDPQNVAVKYYSGISNIEINNFPKAISMFESIIANGNNLYIESAQWYLGLSKLASGKVEEANDLFLVIASTPDHYYSKDANSILEKIKRHERNKTLLNNLFFLILPF